MPFPGLRLYRVIRTAQVTQWLLSFNEGSSHCLCMDLILSDPAIKRTYIFSIISSSAVRAPLRGTVIPRYFRSYPLTVNVSSVL